MLSIRGLRKSFGDLLAVADFSLDVFRGEVLGFLGPNGAGKTTTIRMICGLLRCDGGEVRINGPLPAPVGDASHMGPTGHSLPADEASEEGPTTCNRRARSITLREAPTEVQRLIGLCPQELVIWETLTCVEQLTFVGTQYDLPRKEARRRSHALLERMGLSKKSHRLAKTLSGGMKRRLNLALALVHDPEILVLDEPQAGLDPQSRILVREYIRGLAREKTVILTTHEMDEADRLAHRVGIVDHGRLLVLDTPQALKAEYAGGEVLEVEVDAETGVGGQGEPIHGGALPDGLNLMESVPGTLRISGSRIQERIPEVRTALEAQEIEPAGFSLRKPTLEDVFISLTGRGLRE
jgi:ABC-2 type transport system ATP-binding protein